MPTELKITGYTIDELEGKVKSKVIDKFREFTYDLTQELTYYFKEILLEDGLKVDEVYWSLANCQGDGVAFTVKHLDLEILGKNPEFTDWINKFQELELDFNVAITNPGRYCHYNSMSVDVEIPATRSSGNIAIEPEVEDMLGRFEADLKGFIKQESKRLEKIGYDYIEDATSDERVLELIEINEYLFTKNGTIIPQG